MSPGVLSRSDLGSSVVTSYVTRRIKHQIFRKGDLMSQRQQLRLVFSSSKPNVTRRAPRFAKCELSPRVLSSSPQAPPVTTLGRKADCLAFISPAAGKVVEQLVDDLMAQERERREAWLPWPQLE